MQRNKRKEIRKYGIGNSNYNGNWNVKNSQKLESSFLGTPMSRVQSKMRISSISKYRRRGSEKTDTKISS